MWCLQCMLLFDIRTIANKFQSLFYGINNCFYCTAKKESLSDKFPNWQKQPPESESFNDAKNFSSNFLSFLFLQNCVILVLNEVKKKNGKWYELFCNPIDVSHYIWIKGRSNKIWLCSSLWLKASGRTGQWYYQMYN